MREKSRLVVVAGFALWMMAAAAFAAPAQENRRTGPRIQGAVGVDAGWSYIEWYGETLPVAIAQNPITFTCTGYCEVVVTDTFICGDYFSVKDNGSLIGSTPAPSCVGNWWGDPDQALADPTFSHGTFLLGPGSHSVELALINGYCCPYSGGGYMRVNTAEAPAPSTVTANVAFDVYNQGRGTSAASHVRAVVSDHDSLASHTLGTGRDEELVVTTLADCAGEGCVPAVAPGLSVQYTAQIEMLIGGFGRHVVADVPGNQASPNPDGTFDLSSSESTLSAVSFLYGRYLWIEADSARDGEGVKLGEAGQQVEELLSNDAQKKFVEGTAPEFGELNHLSAAFESLAGGSGNGTPRLEVYLQGAGKIGIRLGNSPTFSDSDATLNGWSGVNLIGNNDAGRYDLSGMSPAGASAATYADAVAAAGGLTVTRIDFIADSAPARSYRLDSINVTADAPAAPTALSSASSVKPAAPKSEKERGPVRK